MKIPEPYFSVQNLVDQAHEARKEQPRPHMGCSTLGHPCDRWLWLSFRWAVQPKFPGRILRVFRRGQNEESIIVSDLRAIGVDIRATGVTQSRVDLGCHVSGSVDGIIEHGLPEAPKTRHVAEFKTHSLKSFEDLLKHGVEKSKPMHFVQMQLYMAGLEIDRAFYLAVCKDDDRLYTERIVFDEAVAKKYIERGHRLALADRMPEPISTDPTWYQCRFCDAHEFCHGSKTTKHVNCRTCAHSTAKPDSTWRCERHEADEIPVQWQHKGCDSHVLHPDLVPWQMVDGDGVFAIYEIDGQQVKNGEGGYCSTELLANPKACMAGDAVVEQLRSEWGGKIVA